MDDYMLEELAHRFCEEFNDSALFHFGLKAEFVKEQSLAYDVETKQVYLHTIVEDDNDDEFDLVQPGLVFFEPLKDLKFNEHRLNVLLHETPPAEIRSKLITVYGQYHAIDVEGRTIRAIYKDLHAALKAKGLIDEYFNAASRFPGMEPNTPGYRLGLDSVWPEDAKWVACYAVTGGAEGHYIHVDVIRNDRTSDLAFLGKTFQGMDHARKIANACADLLGA